mgnify:CR=1 FL=1
MGQPTRGGSAQPGADDGMWVAGVRGLKDGGRDGEDLADGEVDVAIGPRSALFTPFERLGIGEAMMAIGWIISISMFVLSPGMTISWPSGSLIAPVTSVVRK